MTGLDKRIRTHGWIILGCLLAAYANFAIGFGGLPGDGFRPANVVTGFVVAGAMWWNWKIRRDLKIRRARGEN